MKFNRDMPTAYAVQSVEPGRIRIGEEHFESTVLLTPESVRRCPELRAAGSLGMEDLAAVLDLRPELILVGTGNAPGTLPRQLVFALARRGIGLEAMDTAAACRTYNVLAAEGRRVAALLIVD